MLLIFVYLPHNSRDISAAKIHIYFHISDFYFSDDIMYGIVVPFCLTKVCNILDAIMFPNSMSIFYLLSMCNLCYVLVESEIFIQRIGDFSLYFLG